MDNNGKWSLSPLSPAYDMAYSYNPQGVFTSRHQLSVNGKRDNFVKENLIKVAQSMNIKKPNEIIEEVVSSVLQWHSVAAECGVPDNQIKSIGAALRLGW